MKRNDFRNPLIQSGAVLLFVFILISVVANSPTDGFFSSIGALFSALFSGILFVIGLFLAIVFSVVILIGLFLGSVSLYSADKARIFFNQLLDVLRSFSNKLPCSCNIPAAKTKVSEQPETTPTVEAEATKPNQAAQAVQATQAVVPTEDKLDSRIKPLEEAITKLKDLFTELQDGSQNIAGQVNDLQENISKPQNDGSSDKIDKIENIQKEVSSELAGISSTIESLSATLNKLKTQVNDEIKGVRNDIDKLQKKTSVPEVVTGILSYIDLPEDREIVTKKTEEAVSRGLTYAQIDDFFKSSLPKKVSKTLSSHPRLTKDFIRSVKKKFK